MAGSCKLDRCTTFQEAIADAVEFELGEHPTNQDVVDLRESFSLVCSTAARLGINSLCPAGFIAEHPDNPISHRINLAVLSATERFPEHEVVAINEFQQALREELNSL
jgi:hypothetical protein